MSDDARPKVTLVSSAEEGFKIQDLLADDERLVSLTVLNIVFNHHALQDRPAGRPKFGDWCYANGYYMWPDMTDRKINVICETDRVAEFRTAARGEFDIAEIRPVRQYRAVQTYGPDGFMRTSRELGDYIADRKP